MARTRSGPSGPVSLDLAATYSHQYNPNFVALAGAPALTTICTVNLTGVRPGDRILLQFSCELAETAGGNAASYLRFLGNGAMIAPARSDGTLNNGSRMVGMHTLHTIGAAPSDPYPIIIEGQNSTGLGTLQARSGVLTAFYL